MRQLFLVLWFDLCLVVYFTSAGIFDSFISGLHSASDNEPLHNNNQPPSNDQAAIAASNIKKWHTNSSSFYLPTDDGGQLRVDLCEGDILVPLSFDGKDEVIVKSTHFPFKRSTPLICSWNVKVTKNCWRGMITMKINGYSRLADVNGCLHGYYTVSPFMNDTKICGRINTVPEFQWYVENQQPENVTITLRHAGLNDGFAEGLGFTLSGECLPNGFEMTQEKAFESYKTWVQELSVKQSTPEGGPTVVTPSQSDSLHPANVTSDDSTTISPTTLSPTLANDTIVTTSSQDLATHSVVQLPVLQFNTSNNQSSTDSHPENVTVSVQLSTDSNNITEIPPVILSSTAIPNLNSTDLPDQNSSLSNKTSVASSSVTENSTHLSPTRPAPTENPSSVHISDDNLDIPWLILKKPDEELLLPEYYPLASVNSPLNLSHTEPSVSEQVPEDDPGINGSHAHRKRPYSPEEVNGPCRNTSEQQHPNVSTDYTEPPPAIDLPSPGHHDQIVSNKRRPVNANAIAPEVILIDVVLKSPNKMNKPVNNRFQNISTANGSVKIPPIRSPNNSSRPKSPSLSKRRPGTTIKASSNIRPDFYKPPRRNPLLTFDD